MISTLAALTYPAIDPVAFNLGPISVKWYGLAYLAGLLLGWQYIRRLLTTARLWPRSGPPLTVAQTDDLLLWMTLAVVIGGRLGQVVLYDLSYFAAHPSEIFGLGMRGMSFHGGIIGSAIAIVLYARHVGASYRSIADLVCAAAPFGLFLGRIANFINAEHWGRETDAPIGMVFPGGGPLPRHPSQLYEAALEGVVMFLILRYVARIICEIFREPEPTHILNLGPITAGQVYSLPMLLIGIWLVTTAREPAAEKASA
jgi:phosphatidylglycerol:prolipoprotein diacylglycerol transferase